MQFSYGYLCCCILASLSAWPKARLEFEYPLLNFPSGLTHRLDLLLHWLGSRDWIVLFEGLRILRGRLSLHPLEISEDIALRGLALLERYLNWGANDEAALLAWLCGISADAFFGLLVITARFWGCGCDQSSLSREHPSPVFLSLVYDGIIALAWRVRFWGIRWC